MGKGKKGSRGGSRPGLGARRSLGQHFLKDGQAIDLIVRCALASSPTHVFEIGPGKGALSAKLAEGHHETVLLEKDRRFVALLEERFRETANVRVQEVDAITFDFAQAVPPDGRAVVVGNLPYNVAAPIYFNLLGARHRIERLVLMFQREVAERLVAGPGSRAYGSPSVATALFGKARLLTKLPPGAFAPPPKVHSAVMELVFEPHPALALLTPYGKESESGEVRFLAFLRAIFSYRRKTLGNALVHGMKCSSAVSEAVLDQVGLDWRRRPEECPPETLVKVFLALMRENDELRCKRMQGV